MKAYFTYHNGALHPSFDEDYEKAKRFKEGQTYSITYTLARNLDFHRKFFALINTAWDYLTETQEKMYVSKEGFRKTVQMAAGYYEPIFDLQEARFYKAPLSIAFDKMTEEEFEELYERVKDVLFTNVLKNISPEEFMANLNNF